MIKTSLFADQEREAKLNRLGDALQLMERHVDFAALATEVDLAAPRPSRDLLFAEAFGMMRELTTYKPAVYSEVRNYDDNF